MEVDAHHILTPRVVSSAYGNTHADSPISNSSENPETPTHDTTILTALSDNDGFKFENEPSNYSSVCIAFKITILSTGSSPCSHTILFMSIPSDSYFLSSVPSVLDTTTPPSTEIDKATMNTPLVRSSRNKSAVINHI